MRVLAVLVVATPCPLILATPIAIIGGINRAASRQVIVRTGGALERLDDIHVAVFDKTGTLTIGVPMVERVTARDGFDPDEVLRLAAAVEQQSGHQLARSVVQAALAGGATIARASGVQEAPGQGVSGQVDGRAVAVGPLATCARCSSGPAPRPNLSATAGSCRTWPWTGRSPA